MSVRVLCLRSIALVALAPLAACGGGSGGGVNSTPTPPAPTIIAPAATPAPTPTPTPTTATADTGEYRATVGAVSMNALAAYQRNATGMGIGIAVIDSGIDLQSEEFAGRVSAASVDVAGNASVDDQSGHGTAVAFTAAGRRNGAGTHGVAYEATVIALRADRPGTCAGEGTDDASSGCRFGTDAITRGVDAARMAGARVINMSLGGSAMPASLQQAIGQATAAGVIVVIAAGNDGNANPDAFTDVASNGTLARNLVIVAGSVSASDAISSFSDRAGSSATHFLTAVGERVRAPDDDNTAYLWSGTSFAAPQISGAIALLAQAFPNLTGTQIVDLLFRTARDAGAPGVDAVYGGGVLDLTRAFAPVGTATVAGSDVVLTATNRTILSAAMGDASVGTLGTVILDEYGRAFATDIARGVVRAPTAGVLAGPLHLGGRSVAFAKGGTSLSLALAPGRLFGGADRIDPAAGARDAGRIVAGSVLQQVGKNLMAAVGFRQAAAVLIDRLAGRNDPGFLVAGGGGSDAGLARLAGVARLQVGAIGVTTSVESGRTPSLHVDPRSRNQRGSDLRQVGIALDGAAGPLSVALGSTYLVEQDTVLGARFDASLGQPHAESLAVEGNAHLNLGRGWGIGGTWRSLRTSTRLRGGLDGEGVLTSTAFSADIGKAGVFGGDRLGFRLAQPLRVAAGGLNYRLPTLWDYGTETVTEWTNQRILLAPSGRELDMELHYSRALGPGLGHLNGFWRRDPGNVADRAADRGVALRYALPF